MSGENSSSSSNDTFDRAALNLVAEQSLATFPTKLFNALSSDKELSAYIRWGEQGRSILIVDIIGFENYVLPKYWKHNRLRSFIRQLHMYGFRRSLENVAAGKHEYFHELFLKGRRDLLASIQRSQQHKKRTCSESVSPAEQQLFDKACPPVTDHLDTAQPKFAQVQSSCVTPEDTKSKALPHEIVAAEVFSKIAIINSKLDVLENAINCQNSIPHTSNEIFRGRRHSDPRVFNPHMNNMAGGPIFANNCYSMT